MTKPKTNSESEFDYSSIDVMAIGVMVVIAMMIFFFFFLVTAIAQSQPQVGDLVSTKQEVLHHAEDDTGELFMWELLLNESISNDW